jgi:hypothetical protein
VDGVITAGVPEAPLKYHVLECKTHSKKSFDDLQKNGVEKSKPQHYIQMQLYMLGLKIDRALYYAICKDNDEIYTERVRLNKEIAQRYIDRGKRLVQSDRMPEPMSVDPSWYICKMCVTQQKKLIAGRVAIQLRQTKAPGRVPSMIILRFLLSFNAQVASLIYCILIWCNGK